MQGAVIRKSNLLSAWRVCSPDIIISRLKMAPPLVLRPLLLIIFTSSPPDGSSPFPQSSSKREKCCYLVCNCCSIDSFSGGLSLFPDLLSKRDNQALSGLISTMCSMGDMYSFKTKFSKFGFITFSPTQTANNELIAFKNARKAAATATLFSKQICYIPPYISPYISYRAISPLHIKRTSCN